MYIDKLEEKGYPNKEYQSEKLLHRLKNNEMSEAIRFTKINPGDKGCFSFYLIYSNRITLDDALAFAYKLGSTDKFTDVAFFIHALI